MQNEYPSLAHDPRVAALLTTLLEPAIVAGMPQKEANRIYAKLMARYSRLTVPGAFEHLCAHVDVALQREHSSGEN